MDFVLQLASDNNAPVYKQVSDALRQAILSGRLKPGEKLPSTRDLADSISVSRFTVIRSYEELVSQGYIQTTSGSGTYVNREIPKLLEDFKDDGSQADVAAGATDVELSSYGKRVLHSEEIEPANVELFAELNYGAPTMEQIPLNRWKEMLYKAMRFQDLSMVAYTSDPFGYYPLREAIAGYLIRSRSVRCSADRIVIFSGAQAGLDLMGRILIDEGDVVALENPGFPGARRSMLSHQAELVAVDVDENGFSVETLKRIDRPVRAVYVTPSHHDPTGVVLSLPRRLDLLRWADRIVIFSGAQAGLDLMGRILIDEGDVVALEN
ncbi:MAG TPA: aminotransferase class I/II-fold pyridoxal phosphate-dependent enzyme, partial [Candidatus Obscuribacterales bacterium]